MVTGPGPEPAGFGGENEDQEHGDGKEAGESGTAGAARRFVAVPLDARVGTFPLGQWVSEQRRAYRAGTLAAWRIELLEEAGMVWSVPDAAFEENLAATRAYLAVHGTLCVPRTAVSQDRSVGQWLTNCPRPGGLGKTPNAPWNAPPASPPSTPTGTQPPKAGQLTGNATTPKCGPASTAAPP